MGFSTKLLWRSLLGTNDKPRKNKYKNSCSEGACNKTQMDFKTTSSDHI